MSKNQAPADGVADTPAARGKRAAAVRALDFVDDGMTLGLGSGSTAEAFIQAFAAARSDRFERVVCVSTSERSTALARSLGIDVADFDAVDGVDLTVDGADEIAPDLTLIKGGGGALLREKIVASASRRMVVIADDTKLVQTLGAFPLPVDAAAFGLRATKALLDVAVATLTDGSAEAQLRTAPATDGAARPFLTDQGNVVFDLPLGRIDEPEALSVALNGVPGVVENGLFVGLADTAILGDADGGVRILSAEEG